MKAALCLAILATSALWADEAADRAAVEKTLSALNAPTSANIFTADFPNAADLQRFPAGTVSVERQIGTVVISREPMGEATWQPTFIIKTPARFITRSITFTNPDTTVVIAAYGQQTVLFVLKRDAADWKIASFRPIPEAPTQVLRFQIL